MVHASVPLKYKVLYLSDVIRNMRARTRFCVYNNMLIPQVCCLLKNVMSPICNGNTIKLDITYSFSRILFENTKLGTWKRVKHENSTVYAHLITTSFSPTASVFIARRQKWNCSISQKTQLFKMVLSPFFFSLFFNRLIWANDFYTISNEYILCIPYTFRSFYERRGQYVFGIVKPNIFISENNIRY